MEEDNSYVFSRSAACFIIDAFLLGFFLLMFLLVLNLGNPFAVFVTFAATAWQVTFTVWILMYPYARFDGNRITFYAGYQQRKTFVLDDVAGVTRKGNDIEVTLKDGGAVTFSLFWMNPGQRDLLIQLLQCRCEERSDEAIS